MARLPAFARRRLYFGLQRLIGSKIGPIWREFLTWERFSPIKRREVVEDRLARLLRIATTQSEYYRKLDLPRRGAEDAYEWLRQFPPLTREALRENFARIVVDDLREEITGPDSVSRRRYDWLVVKTGGSTGVPTSVVHDARGRDWGRATRLYAARLCGFPLGTPYFRLWGSEQDLLNQEASLVHRVQRALLAEIPLNAFRAKAAELRQHHATMMANPHVRHMMAYVDAAVSLAWFIRQEQLPAPKLKTIMGCAGNVTPEFRQVLEETFGAEVFDKYGSRECCDMACECSHHTGLHVFSPNVYLEIVDEKGRPCPPGEMGRILVTMLNNRSFPMIRYEVGDLGVWAEPGACPCGRPFPRLASLQGRLDDMLVTEDGTFQSSVFVRHFVGVSLNRELIQEWQLEQTGPGRFVFRYIPLRREGLQENLEAIRRSFLTVFGQSAQIDMVEVQDIPPAPSGKKRWIINSYRPTVRD